MYLQKGVNVAYDYKKFLKLVIYDFILINLQVEVNNVLLNL